MKLLGKQLDKNHSGRIKLLPQEPEDLWHAFNIIVVGDRVVTKTIRLAFAHTSPFDITDSSCSFSTLYTFCSKVVRETATGSVTSDRRKIVITIRVEVGCPRRDTPQRTAELFTYLCGDRKSSLRWTQGCCASRA